MKSGARGSCEDLCRRACPHPIGRRPCGVLQYCCRLPSRMAAFFGPLRHLRSLSCARSLGLRGSLCEASAPSLAPPSCQEGGSVGSYPFHLVACSFAPAPVVLVSFLVLSAASGANATCMLGSSKAFVLAVQATSCAAACAQTWSAHLNTSALPKASWLASGRKKVRRSSPLYWPDSGSEGNVEGVDLWTCARCLARSEQLAKVLGRCARSWAESEPSPQPCLP